MNCRDPLKESLVKAITGTSGVSGLPVLCAIHLPMMLKLRHPGVVNNSLHQEVTWKVVYILQVTVQTTILVLGPTHFFAVYGSKPAVNKRLWRPRLKDQMYCLVYQGGTVDAQCI